MLAALVIHDGIASPSILAVAALVGRVPPRGRRYLQAGLIMAAMVTVLAVPMIYRRGSEPASKALLDQNYGGNLTLLLGVIAGCDPAGLRDPGGAEPSSGRRGGG